MVPDHPRSRGVYAASRLRTTAPAGSSPLARGLRTYWSPWSVMMGIIPARAGFTTCRPRRSGRHRDHPRSRGVYVTITSVDLELWGSSPLARGLRTRWSGTREHNRIIPARAGFTCVLVLMSRTLRDHPRSRGVYHHIRVVGEVMVGSSPLARGLPVVVWWVGGY